ncbi:MAG: hypothetical protein AAFV53_09500 [Myxococcota bacterium]
MIASLLILSLACAPTSDPGTPPQKDAPSPTPKPIPLDLVSENPTASFVTSLEPASIDCESPGCALDSAMTLVRRGKLRDAAAACLAASGDRRMTCLTTISVAGVRKLDAPAYPVVVEICRAIPEETAQNDCQAKAVAQLATRAPRLDAPPREWEKLNQTAQIIGFAWKNVDPRVQRNATGRFWAEALTQSYSTATTLSVPPLGLLSDDAHPHVRTAIAFAVVRSTKPAPPELDGWLALVPEGADQGAASVGKAYMPARDASRPTAADPKIDLRLSLLFAAGWERKTIPESVDPAWKDAAALLP